MPDPLYMYVCSYVSIGVVPSKSPFGFHITLLNHYMKGAYYIRGGPSEFVLHTIPVIEKAGGRVLVKAPVSKIIMNEKGRACGTYKMHPVINLAFQPVWLGAQ